jgi:alpha-L-fucosidase 2
LLAAPSLRAASIAWSPPVTIAGDTDVSTAGASVFAYTFGTAATVNGVAFTAVTSTTSAPGLTMSGWGTQNSSAFNTGSAPFANLSSAYRNILVGADYISAKTTVTLTLTGLTVGNTYALQCWFSDPRSSNLYTNDLSSPGGNIVHVLENATFVTGGLGQYAMGTFTADATTQAFTITGAGVTPNTQLNALQLRNCGLSTTTLTPTCSPAAGAYFGPQTVTPLSEAGSTVFYTTDGSNPTNTASHGPVGTGSASVSLPCPASSVTLKAYATNSAKADSALATAVYTTVAAPENGAGGGLFLWYNQPGAINNGMQGLLLGNGRVGAIVPGQVAAENIVLNESSLWSGNSNSSGAYAIGPSGAFGSYQLFGNLLLNLPAQSGYTSYQRALDLRTGLATVDYIANGVVYHRETFSSAPDQVLVLRLTASAPAAYTGSIQLVDGHSTTTSNTASGLMFSGTLANGEKYEAQLSVLNTGGTLVSSGGSVQFTNCDSLTLLVALGTDYLPDYTRNFRGDPPHAKVLQQAQAAAARSFAALKTAHTNDFAPLFGRVALDLGPAPAGRASLPTDQRVAANDAKDDDPGLEALMFQYGRYLLLSSSRTNLPANLGGLWNNSNNPVNADDYHTDFNLSFMYWPADVANLSECFQPLADFIRDQSPMWRYYTTNTSPAVNNGGYRGGMGGTNGWDLRMSLNIWGGMGWEWNIGGNGWFCNHLWDHYAFTGDTNYLATSAYPVMKEICQYWQQQLKPLPLPYGNYGLNGMPPGTLVVTNGCEDEQQFYEPGATYSQIWVWDTLTNYQRACSVLATDAVFSATVANLQASLLTPQIGPWGEIRDYFYTPDNPNSGNQPLQLCSVYPGIQLTPELSPRLAAAALLTINYRASLTTPFFAAWYAAVYARLHDWNKAHAMIALHAARVNANLTANNSSSVVCDQTILFTAGLVETLLQSHAGFINLLPALPDAWPAGSVSGLRARGVYTVGIAWTNAAASATITPDFTGTCTVQTPNPVTVTLNGSPVPVTRLPSGRVQWPAVAGSTYTLRWVLPPFPATSPSPLNYATGVGVVGKLSWVSSSSNALHDVYCGTNYNAVATATPASPEYRARTAATNFSLPLLQPGNTNYWRIDEVSGTNVGAGTVWQFSTSATAPPPTPAAAQPYVAALAPDQLAAGSPVLLDVVSNSYALANIYYDALTITAFDATTAQGGSVTLTNNQLIYTPPVAFSGLDTFSYTTTDAVLGAASTAQVTLYPLPQPCYVWDPNGAALGTGGAGAWDTASTLWNNGTNLWPASGTANQALFGGQAGTVSVAPGGVAANGLCFAADGYAIQSNTLTLNGTAPTLIVNPGLTASIGSSLAGSVGFTKLGSGKLILNGANSYTGPTTISSGTLQVGAGGAAGSLATATITNHAILAYARSDTNDINVPVSGTGVLNASLGNATLAIRQPVNQGSVSIASTFASSGQVLYGSSYAAAINLFTNVTTTGDQIYNGLVSIGRGSSATFGTTLATTAGGGITLAGGVVSGLPGYWSAGVLTLDTSAGNGNITFAGTGKAYGVGNLNVNSGTGTITLTGGNYCYDYSVFNGPVTLGGDCSFLPLNAQQWARGVQFNGDVTGAFTLTASLGSGAASSTGSGTNGLVFSPASASTISCAIAGTSGLAKLGAGTTILTGANTYTGPTAVNGGTLLVNGSLSASSAVTVAAGATLGGAGTVGGTVAVSGNMAPGANGAGTLATGPETWNSGAVYLCQIKSASLDGCGSLNIAGALNLQAAPGTNFTVKLVSSTANNAGGALADFDKFTSCLWNLAAASAGISNFAANRFTVDATAFGNDTSGGQFGVVANGNSLQLQYLAAPRVVPHLETASVSVSQGMQIAASGGAGQNYILLGSTNLASASWIPIGTNCADNNGQVQFTDLQASNYPLRFYRVSTP